MGNVGGEDGRKGRAFFGEKHECANLCFRWYRADRRSEGRQSKRGARQVPRKCLDTA